MHELKDVGHPAGCLFLDLHSLLLCLGEGTVVPLLKLLVTYKVVSHDPTDLFEILKYRQSWVSSAVSLFRRTEALVCAVLVERHFRSCPVDVLRHRACALELGAAMQTLDGLLRVKLLDIFKVRFDVNSRPHH